MLNNDSLKGSFDFLKNFDMKTLTRPRLGAEERANLYDRFAAHLEDGITFSGSLNKSIQMLDERGAPMADGLREIAERLKESGSPADAMAVYAKPIERVLIKSGEDSGRLSLGFKRASRLMRATNELKSIIVTATFYPLFLFIVGNIGIAVTGKMLIPVFSSMVPPDSWPAHAQALNTYSLWLGNNWTTLVAALVIFGAMTAWALPRWCGEVREIIFDRFVPPFWLYRNIQNSGFLLASASLLTTGLDLKTALNRIKRHSTPWLQWYIEEAVQTLRATGSQGRAMRLQIFSLETRDDLEMYADSNVFGESVLRLAEHNIERVKKNVQRFAFIGNLFGLLAVAGSIIWILVSLYGVGELIRTTNT